MVDEKDFQIIEGGQSIEEGAAIEKEFERFRRETLGDVDRKASIYSAGMVASTAFFRLSSDETQHLRKQSAWEGSEVLHLSATECGNFRA